MLARIQQLRKVASDPRLLGRVVNAQVQMGWRAQVPLSVRLQGRVRIEGKGSVELGDSVILRGTVVPIEMIAHTGARLSIGAKTFINYGTSLSAHQSITIGQRCKIGHYVFMMDNDQHDLVDRTRLPESRPIVLEDDVWVAAHAIILPGVRIGRRAVIGAGSNVTHDVPPETIVAGNPARVIRSV